MTSKGGEYFFYTTNAYLGKKIKKDFPYETYLVMKKFFLYFLSLCDFCSSHLYHSENDTCHWFILVEKATFKSEIHI